MKFQSTLSSVRTFFDRGDYRSALKLASTYPGLGKYETAIKQAYEAYLAPNLYIQMGKQPTDVIEAGKDALRKLYGFR